MTLPAQKRSMALDAKVDPRAAMAYMGCRGRTPDEAILRRVEETARDLEGWTRPRGIFALLPVDEALAILPGNDIRRHLDGCEQAVLMAVTLGMDNETALRRASMLGPTEALYLDACSSSLAESAADALNAVIAQAAAEDGMETTRRYSPGYGDLDLSCQSAFLKACGADSVLGIAATDSNLLVPAKSITAVIGLKRRS